MTNVQKLTISAIIIAITSSIATYSWNSQTLYEMVEEHNRQVLENCLTKARVQNTAKEILEYARNCNKDILTNISTPRSVEVVTKEEQECIKNTPDSHSQDPEMIQAIRKCNDKYWTHSTGNTVPPLWFQLIPQASATDVEKELNLKIKNDDSSGTIVSAESSAGQKIRTPFQIYEQVKCDAECKVKTLNEIWITSTLSNLIVSECKEWAIDPRHCIIVASSIVINESGWWNSNACKTRFNCFWFWWWKTKYTNYQESVANFVNTYSRKWYKAKNSSFFYPNKWEYSPSRYCVSEQSSNSEIGCPFWQKHMQNTWNKLEKLF